MTSKNVSSEGPPMATRDFWFHSLERIAWPVLHHLAAGTLRQDMPVEMQPGRDRAAFTHLEALSRTLVGIAPLLELDEPASRPLAALAQKSIDSATDPESPDFCNFTRGDQPLVDTAFLAQSLLRAPTALWEQSRDTVKERLIRIFQQSRHIIPYANNWILFSALIEAALLRLGASDWDGLRIAHAVRQFDQWYKGDGIYGDGPWMRMDYYNSFVIHPMLTDIARASASSLDEVAEAEGRILERARRYAAILERLIAPDGTFPLVGRSITYRFGAMHALSHMALLGHYPNGVSPAQTREALTAVLRRFMSSPDLLDADGWLRIGVGGHQAALGEFYISTGSLYLFAAGLLPLGLPAHDPFWRDPPEPWTSVKGWSGYPTPIDASLPG